jgi:hypothetical protein
MPRTTLKTPFLIPAPKQKRGKKPAPVNEKINKIIANSLNSQKKPVESDQKELEEDDDQELEISNEIIAVRAPSNNDNQIKQINELIEQEKKMSLEQISELKKLLEESKISKAEAEKALKTEIEELRKSLKDLESKKAHEMTAAIKDMDKKAQLEIVKKIRYAGLKL